MDKACQMRVVPAEHALTVELHAGLPRKHSFQRRCCARRIDVSAYMRFCADRVATVPCTSQDVFATDGHLHKRTVYNATCEHHVRTSLRRLTRSTTRQELRGFM